LEAYVLIQSDKANEPLAGALRSIPGVVWAEVLSGPFDAIALARSGSTRQLLEETLAGIRSLPGVTRALPAPLIRSLAARPSIGELHRQLGSRVEAA
jgi:hypothetical protein